MKCTNCKYCLQVEHGHSNYTVEGVEVFCLLKLNPKMPFDRWYREEPALGYAKICKKFTAGESILIDVNRKLLNKCDDKFSSAYTDDPELKILLDEWELENKFDVKGKRIKGE